MGDQRFELVVHGRRHVVDARDVGLQRELVWTVDGAEVARRRTMDDRVELRWADRGARLEVRAGMLGVRRATVHVDGEQVDLRPSTGSAAARREERIRRHPRRHAVVETVVAGFKVVAPLLLVGLGIRLLPDWDLPSIPWPDWDLPSIPWPDVELPSLPAVPWPDWSLPAWVDEVRAVLKYVGPVLLALALAVGEVRRRRDQDARRDAVAGPRGGPADRLPGMDHDWSTPEGLAAIKDGLASTIEGWQAPVAYGVGISPASSSPELEFPHVNSPGGTHGLPAVVLAKIVGHAHGTATYPLSRSQLEAAVETLRPAEACNSMDHPNLAAFRTVLAELDSNPAREAHVVFIGDLDDPVSSEADATLRTLVQS